MFPSFVSILSILLLCWQPGSAVWWGRCLPLLKDVEFEPGDQIITAALAKITTKFSVPYHSFFAVSDTQLFLVHMDKGSTCRYMNPTIITPKDNRLWMRSESVLLKPDPRIKIDTRKGVILAWRMRGLRLPYNLLHCNCRHYSDYLTYGKTFGHLSNFAYWPMSSRCPLYAPIKGDVDVSAPDFVLKDGNGNSYPLNPVPPEKVLH